MFTRLFLVTVFFCFLFNDLTNDCSIAEEKLVKLRRERGEKTSEGSDESADDSCDARRLSSTNRDD